MQATRNRDARGTGTKGARRRGPARAARRVAIAVIAAALASACSGGGSGGPAGPPGVPPAESPALAQFASCDDLRAAIVADARFKIETQAEQLRSDGWGFAVDRDVFEGPPAEPGPAPGPGTGPDAGEGGGDFTDTNTQVPGVDEADVVETDGSHVYALHGSELVTLAAWPPAATALVSRFAIEGAPLSMFVAGGRAVVLSHVYDLGDLGGDDACAWIDAPFPGPQALVGVVADAIPRCVPAFTKVSVVDLSDLAAPRLAREVYLEGYATTARRHGDRVRVVVQRTWGLPAGVPDPWVAIATPAPPADAAELAARVDAWEATALAAIDASALEEWLPARRERVAGELVDVGLDCADVSVPAPGLSEHGATSIVALDMDDDAAPVEESLVVGGAAQVYASADTLLLAQPDWSWGDAAQPTDRTAIHVFDLAADGLETRYRASGFVAGTTLSQLALDVQDDVIRVATTINRRDAGTPEVPATVSRITTARIAGDGLEILGATPDLAPGERIFAARYLGDRAYLVTFRQIDPLFVIDLADPAAPAVLGEVELPGFSEYLHPLGEEHLLTIGRDADLDGRVRGIALRIFDVSDPAAPRLAHTHLLPGEGWSAAEHDHLAFTYSAERGVLAIPYTRYDAEYRSSLVVVGIDAASGFTPRGEVDHARFAGDGCAGPEPEPLPEPLPEPRSDDGITCSFLPDMRRGLLIEDYVYSISSGGVLVNPLAALDEPVAAVELPEALQPPVIQTATE